MILPLTPAHASIARFVLACLPLLCSLVASSSKTLYRIVKEIRRFSVYIGTYLLRE